MIILTKAIATFALSLWLVNAVPHLPIKSPIDPSVVPLPAKPGVVLEEFLFTQASFPSCHAVTIVELDNKELLATYFGGTYERHPDVEIRLQRKRADGTWTAPVSVADGIQPDGKRLPTWNPVIFQPKGGVVMLYYKVGPSPKDWWGEFKTSSDNGHTWTKAQRLPAGILGPIKNKPIQLADGTILSGSSTEDKGWRVHVERSTDGGQSWTPTAPLNDGKKVGAIQPTFLTHSDGRIQLLSRTRDNDSGRQTGWCMLFTPGTVPASSM